MQSIDLVDKVVLPSFRYFSESIQCMLKGPTVEEHFTKIGPSFSS